MCKFVYVFVCLCVRRRSVDLDVWMVFASTGQCGDVNDQQLLMSTIMSVMKSWFLWKDFLSILPAFNII